MARFDWLDASKIPNMLNNLQKMFSLHSLLSSCQTPIVRDYPAHLSVTTFTYALGTLQLAIVAVCVERDLSTWASTFYSDIPAVLYGVCDCGRGIYESTSL